MVTPHSLHILAKNGSLIRSLAPYSATSESAATFLRGISVDTAGLIWSPRFSSYAVDVFDSTGVKKEEYVISSRWWNDAQHPGSEFRAAAPYSSDSNVVILRSIFRDPAYIPPARRPGDVTPASADQIESTFDTMFEAFDRRTGTLLASVRTDFAAPSSSYSMLVPLVRILDDGSIAIEILEPVLLRT